MTISFGCCGVRSPPTMGTPAGCPWWEVTGHRSSRRRSSWGRNGAAMTTPVRASDQDLRALAAIVSQDRPDLPDGEGLPSSLLADLMAQIRCDVAGLDS